MPDLVLVTRDTPLPMPSLIDCEVCARKRVKRSAGTVNGTYRHHKPDTTEWCYGPTVTASRRINRQFRVGRGGEPVNVT